MARGWIRKPLGLACLSVSVVLTAVAMGQAPGERSQRDQSKLMDRIQREGDPELAELIRTAVANHKGASEKEILELTRRVTQGHAQILLRDAQIAQVTRDIEATPASAEARGKLLLTQKELEAKRTTEMANLREVAGIKPRLAFDKLPTESLNAWLKLQVLEQQVLVLETLGGLSDNWNLARHKVVGVWSEKETLDYLQGRLKDGQSLPIRLHIFFLPELKDAAEGLRQKICALVREAHAEMDTEIRMELSTYVGSGESPFYLREGKVRTFYPMRMPRPDGGRRWLASGLVDPNDLEQHILWRLTMPKNVPLTFRIEYDDASSELARQVADTAKAVTKRVGLTELVNVAGILVEAVPESAFLGKWQALGSGVIQSIEIQPGGVCQVLVGEGSPVTKAGTSVRVAWVWTVREILFDINDPVLGRKGYPPYIYRASLNERRESHHRKRRDLPPRQLHAHPPAPDDFQEGAMENSLEPRDRVTERLARDARTYFGGSVWVYACPRGHSLKRRKSDVQKMHTARSGSAARWNGPGTKPERGKRPECRGRGTSGRRHGRDYGSAAAPVIMNVERRNPIAASAGTLVQLAPGPLAEGALAYADRTHVLRNLPPALLGAQYIPMAQEDKNNPNLELHLTIGQPGMLYVILDNRVGTNLRTQTATPNPAAAGMIWMLQMGFVDTGMDVTVDENANGSNNNYSSVFAVPVTPGEVVLRAQYDRFTGGPSDRNMYGVAATPTGREGDETGTGQRRADGGRARAAVDAGGECGVPQCLPGYNPAARPGGPGRFPLGASHVSVPAGPGPGRHLLLARGRDRGGPGDGDPRRRVVVHDGPRHRL